MERGAGGPRPAGAGAQPSPAADERRGVYLEDVAKEFDSWLFWRDSADHAADTSPAARQERGYQVVTAQRVLVGEAARAAGDTARASNETARLSAPAAHSGRCRIPSPTEELLAESRRRLREAVTPPPPPAAIASDSRADSAAASSGTVAIRALHGDPPGVLVSRQCALPAGQVVTTAPRGGLSVASDSGVACEASTADEASDLEEDTSVRSGHEMGNKMGTATPERRKTRGKDSPFVKVIKDSGRKKKLTGSASSSIEVLDAATPTPPAGTGAPAAAVAVPPPAGTGGQERVPRFPRPGPNSPVTSHLVPCQPEPKREPEQDRGQELEPDTKPGLQPELQTSKESPSAAPFVTDSWKQVRRLQEGRDPAGVEPTGSDESSGSFTDPLSSSRARHSATVSATSNTLRLDGDGDSATLTDALATDDLPLDDTPVYRTDEPDGPLRLDQIQVSVDESLSFDPDLARSCDPSLLQGMLSESAPRASAAAAAAAAAAAVSAAAAAPDKSRSFSQSDVCDMEPARPAARAGFTVTKHRKVDLGGRLNQTAPGRDWTASEQCLPDRTTRIVYPPNQDSCPGLSATPPRRVLNRSDRGVLGLILLLSGRRSSSNRLQSFMNEVICARWCMTTGSDLFIVVDE